MVYRGTYVCNMIFSCKHIENVGVKLVYKTTGVSA